MCSMAYAYKDIWTWLNAKLQAYVSRSSLSSRTYVNTPTLRTTNM